ncbi:hypothetical protein C0Q70_18942 [Pomacea canaliculata]|uniref:Uncharacterized protein n=1 Tax=Pomacea canaliculata TaxID=400727 RepID=A0A2T7NHY0_POMCA|nr:hypothetical protein C0Q70_18942 [Pomacea canaliculata]
MLPTGNDVILSFFDLRLRSRSRSNAVTSGSDTSSLDSAHIRTARAREVRLMAEKQDADCTLLLDSSDFFDPPAWVPGRYLQFADFSSTDEQSTLWPVSLPAEMQEDVRLYIPKVASSSTSRYHTADVSEQKSSACGDVRCHDLSDNTVLPDLLSVTSQSSHVITYRTQANDVRTHARAHMRTCANLRADKYLWPVQSQPFIPIPVNKRTPPAQCADSGEVVSDTWHPVDYPADLVD